MGRCIHLTLGSRDPGPAEGLWLVWPGPPTQPPTAREHLSVPADPLGVFSPSWGPVPPCAPSCPRRGDLFPGDGLAHPGVPRRAHSVCMSVFVLYRAHPGRVETPGSWVRSCPPVPRTHGPAWPWLLPAPSPESSTRRLLRRRSAVRSRRESLSLAPREHFSSPCLVHKPPATFQSRTKGQARELQGPAHPPMWAGVAGSGSGSGHSGRGLHEHGAAPLQV